MLDEYEDDVLVDNDQPPYYNGYQREAYNELLDDIDNIAQFENNGNVDDENLDVFPLRANEIDNNGANNVNNGNGFSAQFSSQILDDDGSFPLVSFVNSLSCWHLPTLDHSSWFCIGIYIVLMVVIPFIKDGSTSIVFTLNIPIFLLYCAWYRWFADTSINEGIKFLSTGFYIVGAITFILGIGIYYFMGLPTAIYSYYTLYYSEYYESYTTILECFVIALLAIGSLQEWLKYYLLTRGSNIDEITENNNDDIQGRYKCINQIIGACVGIGLGLQLCNNTISIILFDMLWQSRIELFFLRCVWSLPLSISTSYLLGCGVSDREILNYQTSTFAILFLPILYTTIAYFQLIVLISLHTSIFLRSATLIISTIMNLIVASAAIIEVWQRFYIVKSKTKLRINQMAFMQFM
eukprot:CAMPEP_0197029306 /NCGR_PEP_ID=MMETSP1384-20130603/8780_1 /TAXON_ID=29189 /ORGANISM="Ammonia sp." /LENGTH=407 /DNA_ID=CAMNT_0042458445 /DNA_START=31 /DNA_END=1254 /DNA_ORIENTATION=-